MIDLAICIMAFNEAECLARCLESLRGLPVELHVSIDAATTDNSRAVAARAGAQLYTHQGLPPVALPQDHPEAVRAHNSYSRMRNEFLDQVGQRTAAGWFLWLDADEVLVEGGQILLAALPQMPADTEAIAVRMNLYHGDRLESVMRNSKVIRRHIRFTRRRHEHIVFNGRQALCDPCVLAHYPTQRPADRAAHDQRKLQQQAFLADWQEFQDGRSAFYLADWWHIHGQEEEALAWCERALALPEAKCAGLQRNHCARYAGRLYLEMGRPAQARKAFFEAIQTDWQDAESVYYLGHIAALAGDLDQATHYFEQCLAYPPLPAAIMQQDIHATRALPYYGLACVARGQKRRADAYRLIDLAERAAGGVDFPQFRDLRDKLDRE